MNKESNVKSDRGNIRQGGVGKSSVTSMLAVATKEWDIRRPYWTPI